LVERLLENDENDGTMFHRWPKYDFMSIFSLSRNFVHSSSFKVNQREKLDKINLMTSTYRTKTLHIFEKFEILNGKRSEKNEKVWLGFSTYISKIFRTFRNFEI
jgi:hypothetical protein